MQQERSSNRFSKLQTKVTRDVRKRRDDSCRGHEHGISTFCSKGAPFHFCLARANRGRKVGPDRKQNCRSTHWLGGCRRHWPHRFGWVAAIDTLATDVIHPDRRLDDCRKQGRAAMGGTGASSPSRHDRQIGSPSASWKQARFGWSPGIDLAFRSDNSADGRQTRPTRRFRRLGRRQRTHRRASIP